MVDQPEVRDNPAKRRFEIWSGGELAGFSTYEPLVGARAFVHTEVDDRFAGQGLAAILVRAALTAMLEAKIQVLPFCPFVRRYIQRHPEFVELVPADERERFQLPADSAETA